MCDMKKIITIIVSLAIGIGCGFWSGYYISKKYSENQETTISKSTNSEQPLITNGEYQVTANWVANVFMMFPLQMIIL